MGISWYDPFDYSGLNWCLLVVYSGRSIAYYYKKGKKKKEKKKPRSIEFLLVFVSSTLFFIGFLTLFL